MKAQSFNADCDVLCGDLIELARRSYPEWDAHPDQKKPVSPHRYELNKRIKGLDGGVLIYQYEFSRNEFTRSIAVAAYLTMLGDHAEAACDRITRETASIERQCGSRSFWKYKQEQRIRFSVSAWQTNAELANYGGHEEMIPYLVDMMRRFQRATQPLIPF